MASTPHILIILTSHDILGDTGEKTGFWVEEFAAPYYVFLDAGATVTLASVQGGNPPIDPKSELADFQTKDTARFYKDETLQAALTTTKALADVNPDAYDAVFYPGGHGPLWDLADNKPSTAVIEACLRAGKPVGAVCHASAALLQARDAGGSPAIYGKNVTGFSNTEEAAVGLTDIVPFLLEDALQEKGGIYSKGDDWAAHVAQDGTIVTGQNPASSAGVAEKMLEILQG